MPKVNDVHSCRLAALLVAGSLSLAACGADLLVSTERSDSTGAGSTAPPFEAVPDTTDPSDPTTSDPTDSPTSDPNSTVADTTDPTTTDPGTTDPGTTEPGTTLPLDSIDPTAINFGPDKPPRDYDDFLLATMTDLDLWWRDTFPIVYGSEWTPLQGDVYAAYPQRPDDLPGCGTPRTRYRDVQEFVAFYCGRADFIVYDDGPDGLLTSLAENFGAGTIGIVLAHEFGHAIQERSGALARNLPTVTTEQQADCFAGAWAGRAARSEGLVSFTDSDVRAGLIAMLEVRDPAGIDQFQPGGHGSGFDRVGAFQVGFQEGPVRCGELIDDPLPLMPNQFNDLQDSQNEGNAPFGYDEGELLDFLVDDLNLYWGVDAAIPGFEPLSVTPVQRVADAQCDDLEPGLDVAVALCPSRDVVYINEPAALDLYNQKTFGDFSIGYLIGIAWAEDVQRALDSGLDGEFRELVNDCLAGAWVQTVIPVNFALPQPRAVERTSVVSPGDLDEAVRTAILIGDPGADDNIVGSPFEKIDAFRRGVIGGLDACAI